MVMNFGLLSRLGIQVFVTAIVSRFGVKRKSIRGREGGRAVWQQTHRESEWESE